MSHLCQRNHRHHCNDCSPLQCFKSTPPSLLSTLTLTQWPSLSPSFYHWKLSLLFHNINRAFFSDSHWLWSGMIQLANHGWWTSTAPTLFGANTHRAKKTDSPLGLPSQRKAKRQIPVLVWFINVTLFNYTKP